MLQQNAKENYVLQYVFSSLLFSVVFCAAFLQNLRNKTLSTTLAPPEVFSILEVKAVPLHQNVYFCTRYIIQNKWNNCMMLTFNKHNHLNSPKQYISNYLLKSALQINPSISI